MFSDVWHDAESQRGSHRHQGSGQVGSPAWTWWKTAGDQFSDGRRSTVVIYSGSDKDKDLEDNKTQQAETREGKQEKSNIASGLK